MDTDKGERGLSREERVLIDGIEEIEALLPQAYDAAAFTRLYGDLTRDLDLWNAVAAPQGQVYTWPESSYIARPPFFADFGATPKPVADIRDARALLLLGDSVTTDHISPAGSISPQSPAGEYLLSLGVQRQAFNSYGSRRGNHEVMIRGTFANVRLKNLMLAPRDDGSRIEGGITLLDGVETTVYRAAMHYQSQGIASVVFAGEEYGTGSSRDWAAKGTSLLGVKAVIAKSFERIHRNNLVGMGVLPLQFKPEQDWQSLGLTGNERFDLIGVNADIKPQQDLQLEIHYADGRQRSITVLVRIDTPIEVEYYLHGGILPYVLRDILAL